MYHTFSLLIILSFLKHVYSIIYFLDLNDKDYLKFCNEVKTTLNITTCKMSFKSGDNLDIYNKTEKLWSSEKHHKLNNMVIISKSEKVELCHIMFKDSNTEKVCNAYFGRKEDEFIEIKRDEYYKTSSILRDNNKIFDVNLMFDDWYTTVDEGIIKVHHFDTTVKVLQVVDGRNIIWENEQKSYVAAIRMKYGDEGPENCEIFIRNKLNEIRHIYVRDDLGWHFVNTSKCPIEESRLKIPTIEVDKESKKDDEPKGAEGGTDKPKVFKRRSKYELIISLEENSPHKLPENVDLGDYIICGFNSRIYDCNKAIVTRVSDGFKLLWYKSDNTFLEKVSLSQCPFSEDLLLEIEYVVRLDKDLGPVKGLKIKHWMNRHIYDYDYYVKTKGEWKSMNKIEFSTFRQNLIKEHMFNNRHLNFDSSFANFYDDVHGTPRDSLDLRKNIEWSGFKAFCKSFKRRFYVDTIQMEYNLKINPEFVFNVTPHFIYQNFIRCDLEEPYGINIFMDGDQVIWKQGENGIGLYQFFYYIGRDLQLLHLVIDAKHDKNRYYQKRKEYWYPIEKEEHMKLLNQKIKTYKGKTYEFIDNTYILTDTDEKEKLLRKEKSIPKDKK